MAVTIDHSALQPVVDLLAQASLFERVVALLHLSGLVGALTLAYMKLDKLSDGPDHFAMGLEDLRNKADKIVLENALLGLSITRWDFKHLGVIFPACVICIVAGKPREMGRFIGTMHFAYRQVPIPLWYYFQRWHLPIGCIVAVISVAAFFGCAYTIVWHGSWIADEGVLKIGFWVMATFMAWFTVTALAAARLRPARLEKRINKLMAIVARRKSNREKALASQLKDYEKTVFGNVSDG